MARTKIEYCDETINWYTGCQNSCSYCYARRMAHRLVHIPGTVYERVGIVTSHGPDDFGHPFAPAVHKDLWARHYNRLLRSRKPKRIFLGSMADLCFIGDAVTFGDDGEVLPRDHWWSSRRLQLSVAGWGIPLGAGLGHEFLVLTKRPDLLSTAVEWSSHVRLGVSVTGRFDARRIGELIRVRDNLERPWDGGPLLWASVEPLLDPGFEPECLCGLDWVAVGLQTGPGAPAAWTEEHKKLEDAVRRIVDWCRKNEVPVFVKGNVGPGNWPRQQPKER